MKKTLFYYAVLTSALTLLVACENKNVDTESDVALDGNVTSVLEAGGKISAVFDKCRRSDDGWDGKDDMLGAIKCGETYTVSFDRVSGQWTAEGYNEAASQKQGTSQSSAITRPGQSPSSGFIFVWGVAFELAKTGELLHSDEGTVGHARVRAIN